MQSSHPVACVSEDLKSYWRIRHNLECCRRINKTQPEVLLQNKTQPEVLLENKTQPEVLLNKTQPGVLLENK